MTEILTYPQRKSIRLKEYDYSQEGLYFVTLCTEGMVCLFGKVVGREMKLNGAGKMVERWYSEIEKKYNDIVCHSMVVMPNHMHFIIENVGADLRVCPDNTGEHIGSPLHPTLFILISFYRKTDRSTVSRFINNRQFMLSLRRR